MRRVGSLPEVRTAVLYGNWVKFNFSTGVKAKRISGMVAAKMDRNSQVWVLKYKRENPMVEVVYREAKGIV